MANNDGAGRDRAGGRSVLPGIVRIVATGVFAVSLLANLVLVVVLVVAGVAGRDRGLAGGYRKVYSERNVTTPDGKRDQVAVVRLAGVIMENTAKDSVFGGVEDPVDAVINRLSVIRREDEVKGVLLLMDTPGGGVTASDTLWNEVRLFREETGKPVVTMINQIGASGGYYVAVGTDAIVARPTALVGSIGVIVTNFNYSALLERFDVEYAPIKSAPHKDALSPFKPVEKEEIAWMQGIVDAMLTRFVDAIVEGRSEMPRARVEELAGGLVYLGQEARELGLIDRVGYFRDAVSLLSERAGVNDPVIVEYLRPRGLSGLLAGAGGAGRGLAALFSAPPAGLSRWSGPQPFYLWEAAAR